LSGGHTGPASAFDRGRCKLNERGAIGRKIAHFTAVMSAEEVIAAGQLAHRVHSASASGPTDREKRVKLVPGAEREWKNGQEGASKPSVWREFYAIRGNRTAAGR
jgi:hypothetical protein